MYRKNSIVFLVLCFMITSGSCQTSITNPRTDMELLEDFQTRKLGLFLHFLPVHTPETGDGWAIGRGTSKRVADSIALAWNPKNFDARKIVDFAIKAGSKYIVVVAKHHGGFCIWDSKFTDFDIGSTPVNKDILKRLGEECRKQGLLFGIYYSIVDTHSTGWDLMPAAGQPMPEPKGGKQHLVRYAKDQVRELITRYDPDILWFDGFWIGKYWTQQDGKNLYSFIKTLKPDILTTRVSLTENSRGQDSFYINGASGDFLAVEATTRHKMNVPWEACTSISYPTYGFDPNAELLTKKELIMMFDKVICANGNYLLNIGPKRDGSLPTLQKARFLEMSNWISKVKEAVYNTQGGPFIQNDSIGTTYRGNKIYLHIRKNGSLINIPRLKNYKILSAKSLTSGEELEIDKTAAGYSIENPIKENNEMIDIIALKLNKKFIFGNWISLE